MKVGIVDYGMGNLGSVKRKMDLLGFQAVISSNSEELEKADKLILPGVGHFKRAVQQLKSMGLWDCLMEEVIGKKKPILGICLGLQLMTLHSEEGDEEGFGWIDAKVVRFTIQDQKKYKVPHVGWNTLKKNKSGGLLEGLTEDAEFYFVHSYHITAGNPTEIIATTNYEYPFISAMARDNIFGVQFHPEKSHDDGEKVLLNFLKE